MNGQTRRGRTFVHIIKVDCKSVRFVLFPIAANIIGPIIATTILQRSEYVATKDILPPNMEVMTGAAVAVGINTQINIPAAII